MNTIPQKPHCPRDFTLYYKQLQESGELGKFIDPSPEKAAKLGVTKLKKTEDPIVLVVSGPSMFTGKTETICHIGELLGKENILGFQPRVGIRYGKEQETNIIGRDGSKLKAVLIEDNNLWSIVDYLINENIDPKDTPYIFIDEAMLFIHHGEEHEDAIDAILKIQSMGFNVILTAVEYTFQGKFFTFMEEVLREANSREDWEYIQMTNVCAFCGKRATVTRRVKVNENGEEEIANYYDTAFQAGDNYIPVCGTKHVSCLDQPEEIKFRSVNNLQIHNLNISGL